MDVNWIVDSPFDRARVGDPDAIAVSIDGDKSLTYSQLRDRRNRFVNLLLDAGVKRGDRVSIIMLNALDYIVLYFAIARIGAIAVRVNFRLAPAELSFIIRDSGSCAAFFHSSRTEQLAPIHEETGVRSWYCLRDDASERPPWATVPDLESFSPVIPDLPRPIADDPLMIMYTSGTTGRPKGSVWTHQNSLWTASFQAIEWSYTRSTVVLSPGPLYHVAALEAFLLPALLTHGSIVIMSSGAMSVDRMLDSIQKAGATIAWLPPFIIYELLRQESIDRTKLATVQTIMSGGDPLRPWAVAAMLERLPGITLQQGYGLTEGGSMVTVLGAEDQTKRPESVGRPFPLVRVKVMKTEDDEADPDEVGEVWASSPAISGQYWNMPEESAATFKDGWCRTGDLGRITPDGYLCLTGRAKDMIRSGGENIYPAEIEDVLARHPDVEAVAVVAVPNVKYLEVGCAVVKAPKSVDQNRLEGELRALASSRLAKYKCPHYYKFVDQLPLSASGKVLKRILRDQYASLDAGA